MKIQLNIKIWRSFIRIIKNSGCWFESGSASGLKPNNFFSKFIDQTDFGKVPSSVTTQKSENYQRSAK